MGDGMRSVRLQPGDRELARALFALMAEVFDEPREALSDQYLDGLLAREDFWALAAFDGDQIIGGVTAHSLPMTNTEAVEVFIYDLAVRHDHHRKGVGRHLVTELRNSAAASGIARDALCLCGAVNQPLLETRRNTRGLTPNSPRNARLKLDTSPKPESSATSSTLSVPAASRHAASRRRARSTY